jgi:sporulation integral membrane protein YlbJ
LDNDWLCGVQTTCEIEGTNEGVDQVTQSRKNELSTVLLALVAIIFTIALVIYPKQGFEAGIAGLKVFWDIVFPSLLPFFILSELLLGLGVVRGFGVLLEPLMRPLFSVPGIGAFALSMGLAAGYPMDAVITARFREKNQCSRIEGERLLAFTNTADPLFMFGAVAVGMFKSPELGALLAIAHYVSALLVGVCFKLWGRKEERQERKIARDNITQIPKKEGFIFVRAYREMIQAHTDDGRPFGKLLGFAVTESVQTLFMICGFIVFFAVLIEILHLSGLMAIVGWPIAFVYKLFGIHGGLVNPTLAGFLEIDIGTAQVAAISAPLLQKLALVSGIIAWSGLAVHAQVASVLTQTDIRMTPYFLARFLHAAFASILTFLFYAIGIGKPVARAFANRIPAHSDAANATIHSSFWQTMTNSMSLWVTLFAILLLLSALFVAGQKFVPWFGRHEIN